MKDTQAEREIRENQETPIEVISDSVGIKIDFAQCESWSLTNELRYLMDRYGGSRLQQKWQSSQGKQEWREIETFNEWDL